MLFEKIKTLAEKKGMTIREVERQAGLENGAIGKWRTSTPRFDNIVSVATVLEVSVNEFVEAVK